MEINYLQKADQLATALHGYLLQEQTLLDELKENLQEYQEFLISSMEDIRNA